MKKKSSTPKKTAKLSPALAKAEADAIRLTEEAQTAKAQLKAAKKQFNRAKKAAKQARKELETLAENAKKTPKRKAKKKGGENPPADLTPTSTDAASTGSAD